MPLTYRRVLHKTSNREGCQSHQPNTTYRFSARTLRWHLEHVYMLSPSSMSFTVTSSSDSYNHIWLACWSKLNDTFSTIRQQCSLKNYSLVTRLKVFFCLKDHIKTVLTYNLHLSLKCPLICGSEKKHHPYNMFTQVCNCTLSTQDTCSITDSVHNS